MSTKKSYAQIEAENAELAEKLANAESALANAPQSFEPINAQFHRTKDGYFFGLDAVKIRQPAQMKTIQPSPTLGLYPLMAHGRANPRLIFDSATSAVLKKIYPEYSGFYACIRLSAK